MCKTRWYSRTFGVWICVLVFWFNSWIYWISICAHLLYAECKFLQVSGHTSHAFFPKPLIFNSELEVTWRQDNYGCEQCIFFLCHLQLSNAFIKIKHGSYEFIWDTCERKKKLWYFLIIEIIWFIATEQLFSIWSLDLSWWEKFTTQIRPDARQLVKKVQAHPCFPGQSRNRQALTISFCMVSKSFFQAIPFPLQVCPSSSSGQDSCMFFSLSADTLAVFCFQYAQSPCSLSLH